jgi:hypothetical protein
MGNIKIDELQLTSGDLSPDSESYIRELDELADGEIVGGGYDVEVGIHDTYGQVCTPGGNLELVTDGKGNWGVHDYDKQMSY